MTSERSFELEGIVVVREHDAFGNLLSSVAPLHIPWKPALHVVERPEPQPVYLNTNPPMLARQAYELPALERIGLHDYPAFHNGKHYSLIARLLDGRVLLAFGTVSPTGLQIEWNREQIDIEFDGVSYSLPANTAFKLFQP